MDTVKLLKQNYINSASGLKLGDLTRVKPGKDRVNLINKVANGYCEATDNHDEEKRNQYISALMLLFYGEISKIAEKCKYVSGYEYEDFVYILYNCIESACQYRAWKEGKFNAEQCIRRSIASRGAPAVLYESNLDKQKANVNITSLDMTVKSTDDSDVTFGDLIVDSDEQENLKAELTARGLIQAMINNKKIVESIILDSIAFGDSSVKTKKEKSDVTGITSTTQSFWPYKLVQVLLDLPDNYKNYFSSKYNVVDVDLSAALARIKTSNNQKLYKMVEICLAGCKSQLKN